MICSCTSQTSRPRSTPGGPLLLQLHHNRQRARATIAAGAFYETDGLTLPRLELLRDGGDVHEQIIRPIRGRDEPKPFPESNHLTIS